MRTQDWSYYKVAIFRTYSEMQADWAILNMSTSTKSLPKELGQSESLKLEMHVRSLGNVAKAGIGKTTKLSITTRLSCRR